MVHNVALCQYSNIPMSHWVIFCLEPIPYIRAHMINVFKLVYKVKVFT